MHLPHSSELNVFSAYSLLKNLQAKLGHTVRLAIPIRTPRHDYRHPSAALGQGFDLLHSDPNVLLPVLVLEQFRGDPQQNPLLSNPSHVGSSGRCVAILVAQTSLLASDIGEAVDFGHSRGIYVLLSHSVRSDKFGAKLRTLTPGCFFFLLSASLRSVKMTSCQELQEEELNWRLEERRKRTLRSTTSVIGKSLGVRANSPYEPRFLLFALRLAEKTDIRSELRKVCLAATHVRGGACPGMPA